MTLFRFDSGFFEGFVVIIFGSRRFEVVGF